MPKPEAQAIGMPLKEFFTTPSNAVAERVAATTNVNSPAYLKAQQETTERIVGKVLPPTTEAPRSPTAFHMADEAAGSLRALQERLCSLADRLVGSLPSDVSNCGAPMPSGILNQLDAQAREALRTIAQANEALNRIEAALP